MNIMIEIESNEVAMKQGKAAKTGNDYCIRTQGAYLKLPHFKYPQALKITLPDDVPSYPVGAYTVDPESFWINEFKELKLGRLRLKPAQAAQQPRPAPVVQQAARV